MEKKFTDPKDISNLSSGWQHQARNQEPAGKSTSNNLLYGYTVSRQENDLSYPDDSIERLHGESILDEVIPRLLKDLPLNQRLKILDNGAGAAIFSDQIKARFANRVDIYSTGLSKQAARSYRKKEGLSKLHKNDLRWRSIKELSDYPEFGLIIDTFGEQCYGSSPDSSISQSHLRRENRQHIERVIKKLLPGGYATIAPFYPDSLLEKGESIQEFGKKYSINAYCLLLGGAGDCLKIEKPKLT